MKKIISRRVPFQPYYLFCISEDIYALFIHNGAERFNGKPFYVSGGSLPPEEKLHFTTCKSAKYVAAG